MPYLGPLAFATVGMGGPFAVPARTPWRDVPALFKRLAGVNSNPIDARALAFTILTGSRTSEVIGAEHKAPATWREIGEEDGKPVWIIGGDRMKARRKHMVPLTAAMMKLLGKRQADDVALFRSLVKAPCSTLCGRSLATATRCTASAPRS